MKKVNNYIIGKMANVGCGTADTFQISEICEGLNTNKRDILDSWYNIGFGEVGECYKQDADELKAKFSKDELICLGAYVSARRNIDEF